ncbi:hypothetical protein J6590_056158 [Homalodisca vitripennis]|nr:hypothetical protein J6590_056158 [Homalodisca vitripennis]
MSPSNPSNEWPSRAGQRMSPSNPSNEWPSRAGQLMSPYACLPSNPSNGVDRAGQLMSPSNPSNEWPSRAGRSCPLVILVMVAKSCWTAHVPLVILVMSGQVVLDSSCPHSNPSNEWPSRALDSACLPSNPSNEWPSRAGQIMSP